MVLLILNKSYLDPEKTILGQLGSVKRVKQDAIFMTGIVVCIPLPF